MKTTLIKHIIIFTIISFSFAIEFSTQKLEMSFDSPYNQNLTVKELLEFEKLGFTINDIWERNQFFRSVSYSLNNEVRLVDSKLNILEKKLRLVFLKYENFFINNNFQFLFSFPENKYSYQSIPLNQSGIDENFYYLDAMYLKNLYIQRLDFYNLSIYHFKDYLFRLHGNKFHDSLIVEDLTAFNDDEIEEKFYQNIQALLREKLEFPNELPSRFMKVIRNSNNNVISMKWFMNSDSLIKSRDFEYFGDGLLASIREREGRELVQEIIYGQNKYSKKFYDYVFSAGFLPNHYDHMTEVNFGSDSIIESLQFLKLNGNKIGSIEYIFNDNGHLINEIWRKGEMNSVVREFVCSYEEGEGSYRIIEKDKFGRIVFQEIVSSLPEEKFDKDFR